MDHRKAIVEAGRRMKSSGLTVETWGNISLCDRGSDRVYITPSGMDYDIIQPSDIVAVDMQGNIIEGERTPSIEVPLHTAVYRARPDVSAVIHTHPVYSTAFSSMGEDIPVIHDEGAQALCCEAVRTAAYALPGTQQLADNCVAALGPRAAACLLMSHGAVCVGGTLEQCFRVATVLEMMSKVYQLIRSMGGSYIPISSENIAAMSDFAKNKYGQPREVKA